jgi:hypothetical protein
MPEELIDVHQPRRSDIPQGSDNSSNDQCGQSVNAKTRARRLMWWPLIEGPGLLKDWFPLPVFSRQAALMAS